jgi:hypothetical protein
MKREWAVGMLVLAVVLAVLVHCAGCKPAEVPMPPYCYAAALFIKASETCAKTAPTLEASRTCRQAVFASCGFVLTFADGGAP